MRQFIHIQSLSDAIATQLLAPPVGKFYPKFAIGKWLAGRKRDKSPSYKSGTTGPSRKRQRVDDGVNELCESVVQGGCDEVFDDLVDDDLFVEFEEAEKDEDAEVEIDENIEV